MPVSDVLQFRFW